MSSRSRHVVLVALLGMSLVVASRSTSAQRSSAAIDAVLKAAVDRGDVPGVVAMATDSRGIVYQGAFGTANGPAGRRMSTDSVFRIASMTKAITSVALMQLVDAKKVALDDPASKYVPQFSKVAVLTSFDPATGAYTTRPAAKPVTVRHLLTHTSGLGYGFTSSTVRDFKPKGGETFDVGPLLFEPGEQWTYGTSTDWVGRIVETVSGESLDAYFRAHILQPLGMHDTHFNLPDVTVPRLVTLWRRQADGTLKESPFEAPQRVTRFNGGGGLSSTAGDYVKFMRMLLNHGELNGARILSEASVNTMSVNHMGAVNARATKTAQPDRSEDFTFINDNRDKWGLGFLITTDAKPGLRSAGSLSWGGINNTYFWIDPTRGVAGVVLMQFLPFADAKALGVLQAFEREVNRTVGAGTRD